jgi:hypothetical protein
MKKTIALLRKQEWKKGNGQCPQCWGYMPGRWAPHLFVPTKYQEGHKEACELAEALEELGEKVLYAIF